MDKVSGAVFGSLGEKVAGGRGRLLVGWGGWWWWWCRQNFGGGGDLLVGRLLVG